MNNDDKTGMSQNPFNWIERWSSVFWLAEDILNLTSAQKGSGQQMILLRLKRILTESAPSIAGSSVSQSSTLSLRQELLQAAAQGMLLFAAQQFAFLYDGLHKNRYFKFDFQPSKNDQKNLEKADWMSRRESKIGSVSNVQYDYPDYVLNQALGQITEDIVTLERAYAQSSPTAGSKITDRLKTADGLLRHIQSIVGCHLPDTAVILSYVRPGANVRIVPYGPFGLVGIPASALASDLDLLSIPHEFGHFLYWRGHPDPKPGNALTYRQRLGELTEATETPEWIKEWIEEIFADVISCIIGGPAAALTFQDIMLTMAGIQFITFNDHYPVAAVRPFIYLHVLSQLPGKNSAVVRKLEENWWRILSHRLLRTTMDDLKCEVPYPVSTSGLPLFSEALTLEEIAGQLQKISSKILDAFPELVKWADESWTVGKTMHDDIQALYKEFQDNIERLATMPSPEIPVLFSPWTKVIEQYLTDPKTKTQLNRISFNPNDNLIQNFGWVETVLDDKATATSDIDTLVAVPSDIWQAILYYGGGSTGGPGGGSGHIT